MFFVLGLVYTAGLDAQIWFVAYICFFFHCLFTHSFSCDIVHISDYIWFISTYEWGLKLISKYQNAYVFSPVYTVIENTQSVT